MKKFLLALYSLTLLCVGVAVADYAATQGSGTTFGSGIVGGVHYLRNFLCDPTTVTQCAVVNSAGGASVAITGVNAATVLAGNGVTGTGSPRVTIASDNTAFAVNSVQSGTWNVTNVSGTVSLPTGASTAANQTSVIGTKAAGVAAASSQLVGGVYNSGGVTLTDGQQAAAQLSAAGEVKVVGTGVAQASTTSGQTGSLIMGAVTTAAPTYTTAQTSPVSLDTAGNTRVAATPYPSGAIPYTATATGTTGATTATLAGAASVTTYICGFSIRANATAAATGNATVTGVITATLNFTQWTAPNASGLGITEMIFAPCVPASAANTSIAVVSAAPGTGGVVSVTSWGYKL